MFIPVVGVFFFIKIMLFWKNDLIVIWFNFQWALQTFMGSILGATLYVSIMDLRGVSNSAINWSTQPIMEVDATGCGEILLFFNS